MKRILYIILMMILSTLVSFLLYLSLLFSMVYYHIVSRYDVLWFTDITMSPQAYGIVGCIGILIGLMLGRKWWKIIYIDKVYHFDGKNGQTTPRRQIRKKAQV